jgi:hypothetical protein
MASKAQKMSKQGTAGKSKHVTLTIPHKRETIRRLESGKTEDRLRLHTTLDHQLSMT